MTSDRYGTFAPPEQKTHAEVVESPVESARSIYLAWQPEARHIRYVELQQTIVGPNIPERLYASAVPRVQQDAGALGRMRPEELKGLELLLTTLQQGPPDCTFDPVGIFVSALLNETALPSLDGVFQRDVLGYRLGPKKTLTVRAGSRVRGLGMHAQGTLLNYGHAYHFASNAAGGIQVNYGNIKGSIAECASGGVQLNYGRAASIAHWAKGGVQCNDGTTKELAVDLLGGGVQVNYGNAKKIGAFARDSVQYDAITGTFPGCLRHLDTAKMQVPMKRLLKRLDITKQLKQYVKDPDGALACIRSQDWHALEQDASKLGQDVRDAGKW